MIPLAATGKEQEIVGAYLLLFSQKFKPVQYKHDTFFGIMNYAVAKCFFLNRSLGVNILEVFLLKTFSAGSTL